MLYQSRSLCLAIILAANLTSLKSFSQESSVTFNNRVAGSVDAPVQRPDGSGAGSGVTAQLFRVSADGSLLPLFPATTFRTSSAAATYYVDQRMVIVPGAGLGDTVTLRLRAWEGADYASAHLKGESNDISVRLLGSPPANLAGLRGFILTADGSPSLLPLVIDPGPLRRSMGQVTFNNHIGAQLNAPVQRPDGSGAGAGVTAQLFLVEPGGILQPLFPVTTFRTSPVAASYYVHGVVADVPEVIVGDEVTLRMRAWEGQDYASASVRGESDDFTVRVGGGTVPPQNLWNLKGFMLVPQLSLNASRLGTGVVVAASSSGPKTVRVQSSHDLNSWQDISSDLSAEEAGPLIQENILGHRHPVGQFYRVVAK